MRDRIYIEDFCYDLNYKKIILYIGEVDSGKLRRTLNDSFVNKIYRLDYALTDENPGRQNFIFVENCDLHDLAWPVHEYIADGYDVYVLYEDAGKYYVKTKLRGE